MTEDELRFKAAHFLDPYKGCAEGSALHKELIDLYNDSGLCPRYKMTIYDAWCAAAVSDCFIGTGLAAIFPCVECSCANMITLAQAAGIWVEDDAHVPSIGTVVLYDWDDSGSGDNTGVPDHVGIVQSVSGSTFVVIEGNKSDTVGTRTMQVNGRYIRGFIEPNYASAAGDSTDTDGNTGGGMTTEAEPKAIWDFLYGKIGNACGAAGLMGNLQAESGLVPINLQDSFESKLGYTDLTYTQAVDRGDYTKFSTDSAGYGLAQWTYKSRKKALKSYCDNLKSSIGNLDAQLGYLWQELQNDFPAVLSVLKSAFSVKEASDVVLTEFEQPEDQGTKVKNTRAGYGQEFYDTYAGGTTAGTPTPTRSIDEIAQEVIIGQWGNDPERTASLTAAGYDAAAVQARVNEILGVGTSSTDSAGIAYASSHEDGHGSGTKYTVTAQSGLNVRKGPGTGYDVIDALTKGSVVIYYGYYDKDSGGDKWLLVIANGRTGWVCAKYLS